ncbi:hypothetical protein [Ottowia sp.]|uniref:hypothetical protein n=1 Tax=Ottowia sp. TaxID=1898956 RepID=UPI003A886292
MTKLDFTAELTELLFFAGETAMAIRMYSAYTNCSPSVYLQIPSDPAREATDLMWLSDALHHFSRLGRDLRQGNMARILDTCDDLLSIFAAYAADADGVGRKAPPRPVFQLWQSSFVDLELVMRALASIRFKVVAFME